MDAMSALRNIENSWDIQDGNSCIRKALQLGSARTTLRRQVNRRESRKSMPGRDMKVNLLDRNRELRFARVEDEFDALRIAMDI